MAGKKSTEKAKPFLPYEKLAIALLATTQFTVILDFMVISPLGDFLMKSLSLYPHQFGFVVSAYAFSAGVSGLLTAGFADRFDRKNLLLFFYVGFIGGTVMAFGARLAGGCTRRSRVTPSRRSLCRVST